MGDPEITRFMKKVLDDYSAIRGKDKDSGHCKFWDLVVITTADEEQKNVFDVQLHEKIKRNELPMNLPLHIVSDPPGPKIGNGGSTFTALNFLHTEYGDSLFQKRVLLLHAGGQSKRMPSATILGKIFSAIPTGNPIYQMLDFKLAMYWPFLPKMPSGVFIACSDDFLVYDLGEEELPWKFEGNGFTALAHPSSVQVGTQHGVYVMDNAEKIDTTKYTMNYKCVEVLQKPATSVMYEKKAVMDNNDLKFPCGIKVKGNVAYTDSSFFFGMDVAKKLINFFKANSPISCEIDAYGDFLQALGPNATIDYTSHIPNVSNPTPNLIPTREKIFHLLKGTPISVLVMNASRFIHIGTTRELTHHFCFHKQFQEELGLGMDIFNSWTENKDNQDNIKKMRFSDTNQGCVMHSCMTSDTVISPGSVIEFFHCDFPIHVGQNTIISNCLILSSEFENKMSSFDVPSNLFLHTVPVNHKRTTKYVTIFFHVADDLKKQGLPQNVIFLQRSLTDSMALCNVGPEALVQDGLESVSLWVAPIYPVSDTMSQSFKLSLDIITHILTESNEELDLRIYPLVSISEVLNIKDYKAMLGFRNKLYQSILSS